eukprot:TRINITY_DN1054_c0_g5_i1.p3 TRINITY_DN1054_c0_g5~~TRINITY_DN1054_c0_g5_i1.p3  ORF type:complete len:104 (-),score=25.57 TRINITY_DN1054_c0_g5_i1:145-456(-)
MQQSGGGMMGGLLGTVATGAALGTGSAMAHHAVDSAMGMFSGNGGQQAQAQVAPESQPVASSNPCEAQAKMFADCMSRSGGDMGACELYFNAMQQCKMSAQGH